MTDVAFRLTDDHDVLRELLRLGSSSVFAYVEDTLDGITATIRAERSHLRDATSVARAEAVSLILEGAPISERRAGQLLSYDVTRTHTTAIIWSEDGQQVGALETAANELTRAAGTARPMILPVGSSTQWLWFSGKQRSDLPALVLNHVDLGGARIALGRSRPGLAGFRRSHQEAADTQRLARRLPLVSPITSYDDVEVVALTATDEDQARDFITRTLGPLAGAPAEIRDTLRTYLREECSLTRTAQAQYAHRNTVSSRLDRARDLRPEQLSGRTLQVSRAGDRPRDRPDAVALVRPRVRPGTDAGSSRWCYVKEYGPKRPHATTTATTSSTALTRIIWGS